MAALVLLLSAGAGCEGLADQTTAGTPLVTVHGQITLAPGTTVEGDLRLALAWYPALVTAPSLDPNLPPTCDFSFSLQTLVQGVAYRPTFPIDYTFDITALPPKSVYPVDPYDGIRISTAIGALVAYEDRNRNGILDRCDGAPCPDRILGVSGGYEPGGLPSEQVETLIVYQDGLADWGFYLEPWIAESGGYSLGSTTLPLPESPVDILLSRAPILEAMACNRLCERFAAMGCAVDAATCAQPQLPPDTTFHCASPSEARWFTADGCTVTTNAYLIEEGRVPPAWWPCK